MDLLDYYHIILHMMAQVGWCLGWLTPLYDFGMEIRFVSRRLNLRLRALLKIWYVYCLANQHRDELRAFLRRLYHGRTCDSVFGHRTDVKTWSTRTIWSQANQHDYELWTITYGRTLYSGMGISWILKPDSNDNDMIVGEPIWQECMCFFWDELTTVEPQVRNSAWRLPSGRIQSLANQQKEFVFYDCCTRPIRPFGIEVSHGVFYSLSSHDCWRTNVITKADQDTIIDGPTLGSTKSISIAAAEPLVWVFSLIHGPINLFSGYVIITIWIWRRNIQLLYGM